MIECLRGYFKIYILSQRTYNLGKRSLVCRFIYNSTPIRYIYMIIHICIYSPIFKVQNLQKKIKVQHIYDSKWRRKWICFLSCSHVVWGEKMYAFIIVLIRVQSLRLRESFFFFLIKWRLFDSTVINGLN